MRLKALLIRSDRDIGDVGTLDTEAGTLTRSDGSMILIVPVKGSVEVHDDHTTYRTQTGHTYEIHLW